MVFNNDYYGSVEHDRFACYVVADGLESGDRESPSAKIALQAAITAFNEKPSISRSTINYCIIAAHRALRENSTDVTLKASITVVVTDYQKVRYGWAGNSRFHLYRSGHLSHTTHDHSLSEQISRKNELELPRDKIAQHEERCNLSNYAGQPEFLFPQVSRKIKLENGDVFVLLTQGFWEQCDTWDIRAALDSAENSPQTALDGLERLILDPHPNEIDNYTIAVVFVDKVYIDPNKGKKTQADFGSYDYRNSNYCSNYRCFSNTEQYRTKPSS
jgi:serine/threonine protein phosphatase PrpC